MSELTYFGGAVYDVLRHLGSKEKWQELYVLTKRIDIELKAMDSLYSDDFLNIEMILEENPKAWLDKEYKWQLTYHRLSRFLIKLICLVGYELLPSPDNPPALYGKFFASLRTFEDRRIKTVYHYPLGETDQFSYSQFSTPPINQLDNIGPTMIEIIDILDKTDFTGDYSLMMKYNDKITETFDQLLALEKGYTTFNYDLDECAEYDDDSQYEEILEQRQVKWENDYYGPQKIKLKQQLIDYTLFLTCLFSNSLLPSYTYHQPDMFRAFFYCIQTFADQTIKFIYQHPRSTVDTQIIDSLIS